MEKTTKNALIIGGLLLTVGIIGTAVYLYVNRDKSDDDSENKDTENDNTNEEDKQVKGAKTETPIVEEEPTATGQPIFNEEGELDNTYEELKGKTLYPKGSYVNVRSSPEVNNDQGWWDFWDNKMFSVSKGRPIGKVIGEKTSVLNDWGYRWFKLDLANSSKVGYVRADNVTFKPDGES